MSSSRGLEPLHFEPIGHTDLHRLTSLCLETVERYLEPLSDIIGVVRRGAAHSLVGINVGGTLAGFYVVHPDRRDRGCWWLGWLAIDCRRQGAGLGRAAMLAIMDRLHRLPGCRRVRLLVAPDNHAARRLYDRAGFVVVDTWPGTNELVMERRQNLSVPAERCIDVVLNAYSLVQAMCLRLWRRGAPPAAQMSGRFHGPPVNTRWAACFP